MCICINCEFYSICWVNKGLNKIPKVFTNTNLKLDFNTRPKNNYYLTHNSVYIKVFLNVFTKKQEYEFDVVECEGFCEQPGKWLK
jgi:hypothetical protein